MSVVADDEPIDLASWDPAFTEDPYPWFARLREDAPATRVIVDGLPAWLVTRYDDVRAAMSDPRLSSDPSLADAVTRAVPWAGAAAGVMRHMGRLDPPDHTRLRRLVARAFTPRRLEAMRPRIQQITNELVAALQPHGRADLVAELALPLPRIVISELLGVSITEQVEFARWVDVFFGMDDPSSALFPTARAWLTDYIGRLVEREAIAHAGPGGDAEQGTLLQGLIAARDQGDQLSSQELLAMAFFLLLAGYETTVHLIANCVACLLHHPDQCAAVRADPALARRALEEVLRHETPVKILPFLRVATTDISIGGVVIPAHQPILLSIGAANRDPARFDDPDRFDLFRPPEEHLGFGHGIHFCLGAPLARMEGEIAINTLLAACPDLALAVPPTELVWRCSRAFRGLRRLPVTFTVPSIPAA